MKTQLLCVASAAVFAGSFVLNAHSQEAANGNPRDEEAAASDLTQIVVTAQRMSESVLNIPIAIQAVSGEELTTHGITSLANLGELTPGFVFVLQGFQPAVALRGASGNIQGIAGDPSVAVSLDGVPYASQEYLAAGFMDVGRIEVLRGPQGTVAGRNSTGGAINIISAHPTSTPGAALNLTYGNFNTRAADGYLSGPLVDGELNGRLAFKVNYRDGILDNVNPSNSGHLGSDAEERAARGSLEFAPAGSRFSAYASGEMYKNHTTGPATIFAGGNVPEGVFIDSPAFLLQHNIVPILPATGPVYGFNSLKANQYFREGGPRLDHSIYGGTLRLNYDFDSGWALTSITGYRSYSVYGLANIDASIGSTWAGQVPETAKQYSEELNVTGHITRDLDLLVGGLYLRQNGSTNLVVNYYPYSLIGLSGLRGFQVRDQQDLSSEGVFSQVRWRFLPQWQLTLGGRYSDDRKTFAEAVYIPPGSAAPALTNARLGFPTPAAKTFTKFTPRVALDYKPTEDVTLYASYAEGYKSGGFNVASLLSVHSPGAFAPEKNRTYEVGAKTHWLDGALTANLAVFASRQSDLQVQLTTPVGQTVTNAASAHVNGVELELAARPIQALRLGLNAAFYDGVYDKYCPVNPNRPDLFGTYPPLTAAQCGVATTPVHGSQNNAGEPLQRTPKFSGTGDVEYRWDLAQSGGVLFDAAYNFTSKVYFSPYHENNLSQSYYGLWDLRVTYITESEHWTVSAFVKNLADKRYLTNVVAGPVGLAQLTTPGNPTTLIPGAALDGVVGDPRTYGVTLGYKF